MNVLILLVTFKIYKNYKFNWKGQFIFAFINLILGSQSIFKSKKNYKHKNSKKYILKEKKKIEKSINYQ